MMLEDVGSRDGDGDGRWPMAPAIRMVCKTSSETALAASDGVQPVQSVTRPIAAALRGVQPRCN